MADMQVIDFEALRNCVSRYTNALSTLEDAHASYIRSLEDLRSDWTGRAFIAMSGKVTAMGLSIAKSFANLKDAISELNEYSAYVSEKESNQSKVIASKDIGTKSPFADG